MADPADDYETAKRKVNNLLCHAQDIGAYFAKQAEPDQEPVLQDIEQYRMQMASISTAAIGYWKEGDGIHPDYDTPALRDVAMLYAKYDALYKAQPAQGRLEWQGLFFDAVYEAWHSAGTDVLGGDWNTFASTLEAKLKEKNT